MTPRLARVLALWRKPVQPKPVQPKSAAVTAPRSGSKSKRKARRVKLDAGDVGLGFGIAVIAGFAVYLPWDAYFNADSYAPPRLEFSRGGEVPPDAIASREDRLPVFAFPEERFAGLPAPDLPVDDPPAGVDPITTATIPAGVDTMTTGSVPPAPRDVGETAVYTLIDATDGAALIADRNGIYLLRRGDLLPDGRRVLSVTGQGATARIEAVGDGAVLLDRPG